MGSLLDKGKEHEKSYEWLQAAENYNKAALLTTNAKEYVRAITIQERSGFSYFMASNQQETFEKFRDLIILAIDAYDKALKLLVRSSKEEKLGKIQSLMRARKLQGKTDLNNLGIALTKAYRSLDQSVINKRICIEILSEVLEDYGSKTTRKWISDLITNYGTKGFTMLAVMNPAMHPSEQATAVLDLFDGEISILQSDDPLDCKKSILVKKLRNQDYIKNPICLR